MRQTKCLERDDDSKISHPALKSCAVTRLAGGGQVRQPLTETFFASRFGMVADKFGVDWMVVTAPQS